MDEKRVFEETDNIERRYNKLFENGTTADIEIRVALKNFNDSDISKIRSEYASSSHNFYLALSSELNKIS